MQTATQISFKDVDPSDFMKSAIENHVARLEKHFPRIIGCRVVVQKRNNHGRKGALYNLAIDVSVPGKKIVVGRSGPKDHAHEDFHVAMRDAFAAAKRALEDHARQMRGDVKPHDLPVGGRVAELFPEEGYGFIETADGEEVMFRVESLAKGDFGRLKVGDTIKLTKPRAGGAIPKQAKRTTAKPKTMAKPRKS